MRIALVVIFQLTNTFSREPTSIDGFIEIERGDFGRHACGPFHFTQLIESLVEAGRNANVDVHPLFAVVARSAGRAADTTVEALADQLDARLKGAGNELDALIVILSGAMITEDWQSADLLLIQSARAALKSGTPIAAVFGAQANLNQALVDSVDLASSLDLVDEVDFHLEAGRLVRNVTRLVRHQIRPVTAFRRLDLLVPLTAQGSSTDSIRSVRDIARQFSADPDVIDVSLFPGFPYADVPYAGFSLLVTTDGDLDKANSLAQRLQMSVWDQREELSFLPLNVETAVHEAMLNEHGPVVIADLGDDPVAGATGDGTGLLWALIDLGAPAATLAVIVDPAAVDRAIDTGVGRLIKLDIGGSIDRRAGYPITITATVRRISDGRLKVDEHCQLNVGRAAVLDVEGRHGGQIDVIVTERAPELIEPGLFAALGIDIAAKRIIAVKSSIGVRNRFGAAARKILETSTPGITTPVFSYFTFQHVPRPIYPLDPM